MRSHSHTARHSLWRTGANLVEHAIAYQSTSVTSRPRCLDILITFELANIVDVVPSPPPFLFFSKRLNCAQRRHPDCIRPHALQATALAERDHGTAFLFFLLRSLAGETLRSPRSKLPRAAGGYVQPRSTVLIVHCTVQRTVGNPGPKLAQTRQIPPPE